MTNLIALKGGTELVGDYRIERVLGAGGFGITYLAEEVALDRSVTIKEYFPSDFAARTSTADAAPRSQDCASDYRWGLDRFIEEAQTLARFSHPNIVKVFEIGESNERGFIAMEYLEGGTLRERLEREKMLPLDEIRTIVMQICTGLEEVHSKGIVHRDMKTANVMIGADGNIRIMDFGLSKSPLVTTMTSLGTVLGTLGYVAPEQVTSLDVDRRTDIFSLGVIMYELLTGQLPFKGENEIALIHSIFNTVPPVPSTFRNEIPAEWDSIVMKCLSKDINDRFQTAEIVRKEIFSMNL